METGPTPIHTKAVNGELLMMSNSMLAGIFSHRMGTGPDLFIVLHMSDSAVQ